MLLNKQGIERVLIFFVCEKQQKRILQTVTMTF